MLGPQLALAVLLPLRLYPYDDVVVGELVPIARWWTTLHAVQFVLFALVGAVVWMLVEGLTGIPTTVARVAAVFVLFYDAGDAIAGITNGILSARPPAAL